jgi:virulence-associated protein VapD
MASLLSKKIERLDVQFELSQKNFKGNMYAIAFDLDTNILQDTYAGSSWNNAYMEIRKILAVHGFEWQQGSVYFGNRTVDAVTCFLAIQDLTRKLHWFAASVQDIRMLRIEEMNDLRPVVDSTINQGKA